MPNIYNYLDYRKFLDDFYKERKALSPSFSFNYIAQKAGFKSKSFFPHVIEGKRNLSKDSLFKLRTLLKLNDKALSYFSDLVAFDQAKSVGERTYFFKKLLEYKKRGTATVVVQRQYEYYSKWYYSTIRELITIIDFKENYELLGRMIKPPISCREVRAAVKLLLKLGFIEKTENGYRQTNRSITTGDEVRSLGIENFHLQNMVLAAESIDTVASNKRDISCVVAGLSPAGVETIKEEIQQFRKRLVEIIEHDEPARQVYHINFQFFPTSTEEISHQEGMR
jgi:uncharacterized protein (TIGR02147 family)